MAKKRERKAAGKSKSKEKGEKGKNRSRNIVLIIILVVFIGVGINIFHDSKPVNRTEAGSNNSLDHLTEIKVIYFYIPTCPNCQAVKPYMAYLESKYPQVTFYKYNVKENEGIREFDYYRKKFDNKRGGVPFAIFVGKDTEKAFLGRTDVLNLEKSIAEELNLPLPNQTYEIPPTRVGNCIDCHQKRDIPPPSTYSCETCCHSTSAVTH